MFLPKKILLAMFAGSVGALTGCSSGSSTAVVDPNPGNNNGNVNPPVVAAPADRYVISGNNDGSLSILRVNRVAGFATTESFFNASGFSVRDLFHDAANGRLLALTSTELLTMSFDNATGELVNIDSRATNGDSSHFSVSDDGAVAYVASGAGANNSVEVFTINSGGIISPSDSTALTVDPDYIAQSPAGEFLYVVSRTNDEIARFDIDPANGSVSAETLIATDEDPTALVLNPAGNTAYLTRADNSADSLEVFDVDAAGNLTPRAFFDVGNTPIDLIIDEAGENLYVIDANNDRLHHFSVDVDGDLTFISDQNLSFTPTDLSISLTGAQMYVSHSEDNLVSTFNLDTSTGAPTLVDFSRVFNSAQSVVAVGGEGEIEPQASFLLAPDQSGMSVFTIGVDGALTLLAKDTSTSALMDGELAVDLTRNVMIGAGEEGVLNNDILSSYTIDPLTGATVSVNTFNATVSAESEFTRVELGRSGEFFYVLDADDFSSLTTPNASIRSFDYSDAGVITGASIDDDFVGEGPENMTMHPAGRFLYSVNSFSDNISALRVDKAAGTLAPSAVTVPGVTGPGVGRPIDLRFHPNGRFAYVSLEDDSEVVRFSVNASTGALENANRVTPPQDGGVDVQPGPIAVHPSGEFVYVGERNGANNISVYFVEADRSLTHQSRIALPQNPTWLEIDPLGGFLYVRYQDESVQVFTIDPASGDLTDTFQIEDGGNSGGFMPTLTIVAPLSDV